MTIAKYKDRMSALLQRFKKLQGSPTYLARGVAVGVFVGFSPISPLKTVVILTMTSVMPSSTIAALLVCTSICNPLTYIPLYYIAWAIGDFILPGRASWALLEASLHKMQQSSLADALLIAGQIGFDTIVVMLAGGCLLALPLAFVSYPVARKLFVKFAERHHNTAIEAQ